jgi:cytochrome c oxidase subunit 2
VQSGQTVTVDEGYLRESIVNPQAKLVVGFGPIMPTFQGQVSEDQLVQLIAFIKSLQGSGESPATAPSPSPAAASATQNR